MSQDLIVHTEASLMTPEMATERVSRAELVNMMMVEYVEQQNAKLAAINKRVNDEDTQHKLKMQEVGDEGFVLLESHFVQKLSAWRQAVTDLMAPLVGTFTLYGMFPVEAQTANSFRDRPKHSPVTGTGASTATSYQADRLGNFSHTPRENAYANYLTECVYVVSRGQPVPYLFTLHAGIDFPKLPATTIVVTIDVKTVFPEWYAKLEAVLAPRLDRVKLMEEYHAIHATIKDPASLEKKALARLTKHALQKNAEFPALPKMD